MNITNFLQQIQPQKLSDILGQTHLIGSEKFLSLLVSKQQLFSLILYGPAGTGKSTIAKVLAQELNCQYRVFNCAYDNKHKLIDLIELLKFESESQRLLIVEEIHRLNTDKQDIFLNLIEQEGLTIIATTTENPFFVINPAIRSRAQLVNIEPISDSILIAYVKKLIADQQVSTKLSDQQINQIVLTANGDLRFLLHTLAKCTLLYPQTIDQENLDVLLSKTNFQVGADNDEYHNLKSALQKSIRGSDVNASLYYLARLLVTGDLKTITRRVAICAFEDIGLANMSLCDRVINALNLANQVGLAEAYNILGPIIVEMALSPKSNSGAQALAQAQAFIKNRPNLTIPKHLWDNHYASAVKLGVQGYLFPHDYPYNYVQQQYLPSDISNMEFYHPNQYCVKEQKWQQYWTTLLGYLKKIN